MRRTPPILLFVLAAAAALALGLPAAASAAVLISQPRERICIEGKAKIEVGVWYQSYSGGPRWFSIELYNPRGKLVLYRKGLATTTWKIWGYDPPARPIYGGRGATAYPVGTYKTVYRVPGVKPYTAYTRVHFCGD
jgi:hypothetical protein